MSRDDNSHSSLPKQLSSDSIFFKVNTVSNISVSNLTSTQHLTPPSALQTANNSSSNSSSSISQDKKQ